MEESNGSYIINRGYGWRNNYLMKHCHRSVAKNCVYNPKIIILFFRNLKHIFEINALTQTQNTYICKSYIKKKNTRIDACVWKNAYTSVYVICTYVCMRVIVCVYVWVCVNILVWWQTVPPKAMYECLPNDRHKWFYLIVIKWVCCILTQSKWWPVFVCVSKLINRIVHW